MNQADEVAKILQHSTAQHSTAQHSTARWEYLTTG
jgi:hypothetical protein